MISQVMIVFFSCFSVWALSSKRYRLGFCAGLCGQPFWIWTTLDAQQWGMFIVSLWFTYSHIYGLLAHRKEVKP